MKRYLIFLLITTLGFATAGCEGGGEIYLPPYTGSPGEVVVVIDDQLWESKTGETIREYFSRDVPGLDKHEPYFSIVQRTQANFGQLLQVHRNILIVRVQDTDANEEPRLDLKKNMWANDQLVIEINTRNEDAFVKTFSEQGEALIAMINKHDKERLMDKFYQQRNVPIKTKLEEKYKLSLNVPRDFEIVKETEDFIWIRRQMQRFLRNNYGGADHDINESIFVYSYPYNDTSMFTADWQLMMRDSLLKEFVPGTVIGSYMTTERHFFEPVYANTEVMGQFAIELRGLWKLDGAPGAFMGGPFIGLAAYDEKRGRIVYVEGNVFAPKFDKREYIRELEAMIYSVIAVE